MKKNLIVFLLFLFCCNVYARTGILAKQKKLNVVQTQWFDIIYPPECEQTASLLYGNADRIYTEVADFMCTKPSFRLPVVITPATDQSNAFFNPFPYNHIVLYDTSSSGINDLLVYSEQFLSTFEHELTHAVTFSMKNEFWSGAGKIFGDVIDFGFLSISTEMAEGATVSYESSRGEGRLNNEYAKHVVKQAKLEGKFPSYYDAQGSSSMQNVAHPYKFGSAFAQYLQETYGMQSYAQFWYDTVNLKKVGLNRRFKNVYGIKLKQAWKDFENSYEVPSVPENPVKAKIVNDFFEKNSPDFSKENNQGANFTSLTVSQNKVAWLDSKTGQIYTADRNNLSSEKIKPEKLLLVPQASSINFSEDGKLLVISAYSYSQSTVKAVLYLYDLQTKQFFKINETGLKCAGLVKKDGEYFIISTKYISPASTIQIHKIIFNDGKICGTEKTAQINLKQNQNAENFTAFSNGNFAYIFKDKMNYSIRISDLQGNILQEYAAPLEKMLINSLSLDFSDSDSLYFSWAIPGTLPRLGKLNLEEEKFTLSNQDISGGIFNPVSIDDFIIYIGKFYEQSRILQISDFEGKEYLPSKPDFEIAEKEIDIRVVKDAVLPEPQKFNSFDYYKKGVFLPVGIYSTGVFINDVNKTSVFSYSPLGATYITSNPWSNVTDDLLIITAGFNLFDYSFGIQGLLMNGTSTSLLHTTTSIKTEFDNLGWKESGISFKAESTIPFGRISNFLFASTSNVGIGRQNKKISDSVMYKTLFNNTSKVFGLLKPEDNTIYYSLYEVLAVGYSNVHKTTPGNYNKAGIKMQVNAGIWDEQSISGITVYNLLYNKKGFGFNALFSIYVPQLLPVKDKIRYTTNLPTRLDLRLLPLGLNSDFISVYSEEVMKNLFSVETETVLFAYSFEKSVPFFTGLYVNDAVISAGYLGDFSNNNVYCKLSVKGSPNLGCLSGKIYFDCNVKFNYSISNNSFSYGFGIKGMY